MGGDYSGVARALGAYAERLEDPDQIVPGLGRAQRAVAAGQTAVLEVITCPELGYPRLFEVSD
jgi:acetolactate synthase-1/2/3 large subunit